MTSPFHSDQIAATGSVHQARYFQDSDPGTVGAYKEWIKGPGTSPYEHYIRDPTNTSWIFLGVLMTAEHLDALRTTEIVFTLDGAGLTLTPTNPPVLPRYRIPTDCVIEEVRLFADAVGSISIAVERSTYADFPTWTPIQGSTVLALSTAQKAEITDLSGFVDTDLVEGDLLRIIPTGPATSIAAVHAHIKVTRTLPGPVVVP